MIKCFARTCGREVYDYSIMLNMNPDKEDAYDGEGDIEFQYCMVHYKQLVNMLLGDVKNSVREVYGLPRSI